MEILSPAGHWEAMVAAVQSGADAVYLGFGDYNARRGARNFSKEEFLAAVSYCHLRGVRVYVTVNTLLTDRELPGAAEVLRTASQAGADAVIVQDWGVLRLARAVAPDLPLHGSTQMTIHTLSGVEEGAKLGLRCAVLARELSREEIALICERSPIAIEVFGHGALCMCYSGQCAMSALIGQRSGNRGTCAQPCRLPYRLDGGKTGHPLSLKDASLARHIPALREMGVASLKLEGRMKRPEYVAVVTEIYSRLNRENRSATAEEERTLALAFSRSGFTDGYWRGETGPEMFGTRQPDAPEPGELFAAARSAYERENRRLAEVTFTLALRAGEPAALTARDDQGHEVSVSGPAPEDARTRPLTLEAAAERLGKTGGTAFRCAGVTGEIGPGLTLSAAALNGLRREALAALEAERTRPPVRRVLPTPPLGKEKGPEGPPALTVSLMDPAQLTEELLSLAPASLSLPLHLADAARPRGDTVFAVELPRIWRDRDEPALRAALERARQRGYTAALVHNIGHLSLLRGLDFRLWGDFGLNVTNTLSLEQLADWGMERACLSFELRHQQIRDLGKPLPCEAVVYGRLPLMITENCLISNGYGCRSRDLAGPCRQGHSLTDRRGERFPLCPQFGCRTEIENGKVLYLADKPEWRRCGLAYARLRFTTESPAQCAAVLAQYRSGGGAPPEGFTRGLFYRGVE